MRSGFQCGVMQMNNVTVSIDDETYRPACEKASESGVSVPDLLRTYLSELASGKDADSEFLRLQRLQDDTLAAIEARGGGVSSRDNLRRDEIYEEDAILILSSSSTPSA